MQIDFTNIKDQWRTSSLSPPDPPQEQVDHQIVLEVTIIIMHIKMLPCLSNTSMSVYTVIKGGSGEVVVIHLTFCLRYIFIYLY